MQDDDVKSSSTKRDQYLHIQKLKYNRQRDISNTKKLIRGSSLNVSNILAKIVSDTDKAMRKLFKADVARRIKLQAFSQWKHETKFFTRRGTNSLFNEFDVRLIVSEQFESPITLSVQLPSPSNSPHKFDRDNKLKPKPKNSKTNLKSPPHLLIEKIIYHGPYDFGSFSSRQQLASKSSDSNLIVSHAQAVARRSPNKKSTVKVSPSPTPPPSANDFDDEIVMTGPWDVNIDIVDSKSVHIPMTHSLRGYGEGRIRGQVDSPPQLSVVGGDYAFSLCSGSMSSAPRRDTRTVLK